MSDMASASASSVTSAGAGITGGYEGSSFTLQVCIAFFSGLAIYNVLELLVLIFGTFQRFRGLYFWSLVISSIGIIPYALGFLFKFFYILPGKARWFSVVLLTIGWYPMVTGQAVVLWSRLHLVVHGSRGDKILKYTKWMIICNAICLHIPTTVLTFGSNIPSQIMIEGYNVMEKIQMCGFFIQEVILSSVYIIETTKILRTSIKPNTRRLMYQLIAINALIIIMDLGLLGLECASLYIMETIFKGFLYSLKLKLEFAILSKLVQFVGKGEGSTRREPSIAYLDEKELGPPGIDDEKASGSSAGLHPHDQVHDFVDLSRTRTDHTHALPRTDRQGSIQRPGGVDEDEWELAQLEHAETVSSSRSTKVPGYGAHAV